MSILTRCIGALAAFVLFSTAASAADWPHWRGPNHDGISAEKDLVTSWGESGPKVLWERAIGPSYSSMACVGGRIYTCGTQDDRQVLFCLDAKTGKEIWKQAFGDGYSDGEGDGTRATPTVDDGRVFILGAHGRLVCFDAETGKESWSRKFDNRPSWGYSGSVLVEGDLAIVSAGRADGALLALDKKTGRPVWKHGDAKPGYATPYPFTFNGKRYVCGFMARNAIIVELETGKQVWSMPWETDWHVNAATPIFHDGHLFLASGYNTGCGLYKLSASGDGLSAEEVWRSKILLSKFQTPILYEGKLYTSDQKSLKCVDFQTGERKWRKRRIKHGTIVLADGHLILLTGKGQLQIAKATPEEFDPTAKARILSGRCWTVPVLSSGRLYARDMEKIVCIDMRK